MLRRRVSPTRSRPRRRLATSFTRTSSACVPLSPSSSPCRARTRLTLVSYTCQIREVSIKIAVTVIQAAQKLGVDRNEELRGKSSAEIEAYVRKGMYHPLLEAEQQAQ